MKPQTVNGFRLTADLDLQYGANDDSDAKDYDSNGCGYQYDGKSVDSDEEAFSTNSL